MSLIRSGDAGADIPPSGFGCFIMRVVSPEYLKERRSRCPAVGSWRCVFALLAALGAVGAWLLVAYEWRVGCEGVGGRVAPASGSRQAFRCADLGQRDARYFFAVLSSSA